MTALSIEKRIRKLFHGVWGASPWNEERLTDSAMEVMRGIIGEIREEERKRFKTMVKRHARDHRSHPDPKRPMRELDCLDELINEIKDL